MDRSTLKIGVLLLVFSFQVGCSSYFKRKSCEKVNWHEHGYKVAMEGKRLSGNELYKQCQSVEAEISHSDADLGWKAGMKKYCSSEGAKIKGQNGELFSNDFCGVSESSRLKAAYKEGLKIFCRPTSGYSFGAKGGTYLKVCSPGEETAWMPQYNRGRKVYLQGEIRNRRGQISQIDSEVRDYENQKRDVVYQMTAIPKSRVVQREKKYNPDTKTYTEYTSEKEGVETERRRRDLQWSIDSLKRKIEAARNRQRSLRAEIRNLERERAALGEI